MQEQYIYQQNINCFKIMQNMFSIHVLLISYFEIFNIILKVVQTFTISFYSIEKFHYLSVNIIKGGTFTWKHFCWICWVPCVLILYKCVGLRIFVLYIVKLINRKGFSLECKISQYKYLVDKNC